MKRQNKTMKLEIINSDNASLPGKTLNNDIHYISNNVEFGKILKFCRQEAGMTQEEISKVLGMHKPNISRLESSRSNISINSLIKYLNILNKQIEFKIVSKK